MGLIHALSEGQGEICPHKPPHYGDIKYTKMVYCAQQCKWNSVARGVGLTIEP
jgi:hypothetical protein